MILTISLSSFQFRVMRWTLAVILVISLAFGITHAAVSSSSSRQPACPRGQTRVRDKCMTIANHNNHAPTSPIPTTPRSSQTQQQARSSADPTATNNNINTCPLGQTLRQGKCTPKQCPMGMSVNAEGKCACNPGLKKDGDRCINETALQSCPGGFLPKKGNCVLPTPKPGKVCPPKHKINEAGKCTPELATAVTQCPQGERRNRKGKCIPIVAGQACGADKWIDEQGNCGSMRPNNGCPVGKERNGVGNCVKIQICTTGQVKDQTGVCQPQSCNANQQMRNGQCVDNAGNVSRRG